MKDIKSITKDSVSSVTHVLTDIDDTLTREGLLEAQAFTAIWDLHNAGISVIPVTGRPAGWCDCIVRQWPVEGIVGENGAFIFYRDEGKIKELINPENPKGKEQLRNTNEKKKDDTSFDEVWQAVKKEVPAARIARDQFSRMFDLAIDFREDEPKLSFSTAEKIKKICNTHGAEAKISSIHVNTWFGTYDKLSMVRYYFDHRHGWKDEEIQKRIFYCGDSPNDEPMFAFFPKSCGVANIETFLTTMVSLPIYKTNLIGGSGFAEFTKRLLALLHTEKQ